MNSAGVGTPPRSILRTVSSASPAAAATSRTDRVPRAWRSSRSERQAPGPVLLRQRHAHHAGIVGHRPHTTTGIPGYLYRRGRDLPTSSCPSAPRPSSTRCARPAASSPRPCRRCAAAAVPGVRLRELDDIARDLHPGGRCAAVVPRLPPGLGPHALQRRRSACRRTRSWCTAGRAARRLREGDLLSVDCGAIVDGWNGDAAVTVHVGAPTAQDTPAAARPPRRRSPPASPPPCRARRCTTSPPPSTRSPAPHGFAQLPDHGGHGIGRSMHEPPFVPNAADRRGRRYRLRAGNTIAIEPMLHAGDQPLPHQEATAGRSSPPTASAPPTSSTPSPSPTTGRWSSPRA